MAGLIDTPKGRPGRRRRAFTQAQAAALIVAARSRPVLELHGGLKDPRRPASLMHAYIVVSLMAGVRPGSFRGSHGLIRSRWSGARARARRDGV